MLKAEEIVEFITECSPSFEYSNNREKFGMFTAGTQHIYADTVEELLETGISRYKKHGNNSYLRLLIEGED